MSLYVPDCARNLVSVGRLDDLGFNFKIGKDVFLLYKQKYYYSFGTLVDGLHHFNLDVGFIGFLFIVMHGFDFKHNTHNENFILMASKIRVYI